MMALSGVHPLFIPECFMCETIVAVFCTAMTFIVRQKPCRIVYMKNCPFNDLMKKH